MKDVDYSGKTIAKNSVLSFMYKVISMVLSFVSAPILLKCLGEEKYGIWATIGSIITWIYYSDLGIGGGLRNKLSISLGNRDLEAARGYILVAYAMLTGISVFLFVLSILVLMFVDISKNLGFDVINENVNTCLIVAFFLSCINFVLSLVNNLAYAEQRASVVSFFNLIGQSLFVITITIYSISGIGSILCIALGEGVAQVLKNLLETYYILKRYPELRVKLSDYNKEYSKGVMSFGILVFIFQISSLIHNTTDNILISYFFGASDVTPYNFCFKFFNFINSIYLVLLTPLISAYTVANTKNDYCWIRKQMNRSMILYGVFFVGTIIAVFLFKPIARLWVGKELDYPHGLVICTSIYFLLLILSHNTTTLQTGMSDLKLATIAVAIGALLNIPASILFAKTMNFGVVGIMIGSAISMIPIVIVGIYKYIYYQRRVKNNV